MLLGSLAARFGHGLLIIAAPESRDSHDNWDAAREPVHAGPDSIYVGVQQAASGIVSVECYEEQDVDAGLAGIYSGQLNLPSKKFIVYDPNETVLLTILTDSAQVHVSLFSDDADEPTRVLIYVRNASAKS